MAAHLAASVVAAAVFGLASAQNPIAGHLLYVNPSYDVELESSISSATGAVQTTLKAMRGVGSAYWLDTKAKVDPSLTTNTTTAAGILTDAASKSTVPLVTLIVYDLPNRDCHAKASNGEICCNPNPDGTCDFNAGGDCSAGLADYKNNYITPLASTITKFCGVVPMALVIEPDSLPNLATNQADPHCGNSATTAAYSAGIPYAVNAMAAACPSAALYLDAAHGGWLGWPNNLASFSAAVDKMAFANKLRGFSTNVANYQPLGVACPATGYCLNGQHQGDPCCADPCKLEGQYNPANNEMNYVQELAATMTKQIPTFQPHFLVDSGRNGVPGMREDCANWCNIRGAGVGLYPTTDTGNKLIDAFMWLKTPGESDGCTQTLPSGGSCDRYDSFCGSEDSIGSRAGEPKAPIAGKWFDYQIKMLAANANMGPNPNPPGPLPPSPPPPPPSPPSPPTPGGNVCADPGALPACNTCADCCHSFIPAGAPCDSCVKEKCAPAPVCATGAGCTTSCKACCVDYLPTPAACEGCIKSSCPSATEI